MPELRDAHAPLDAPTEELLNFNSHVGDTTEVGSYPDGASPYGALDMAGNVWEWVADTFSTSYYASSPQENPQGPTSFGAKVLRGGSWFDTVRSIRARDRYASSVLYRGVYWGFRCAR